MQRASLRGDHQLAHDLRPWIVIGEPATLERAVLNLLANAVKFSPARSVVQVHLHDDGLLQVIDDGPGIALDHRQRVFERFWRAPLSRALPGNGLGLAIVADVAHKHGGHVWAASEPNGDAVMSRRLPGRHSDPSPEPVGNRPRRSGDLGHDHREFPQEAGWERAGTMHED